MMKKLILVSVSAVVAYVDAYGDPAKIDSLSALDAHGFNGVQEITATYAWMNHSDYGFPANLIKYLSPFPPPLDENARPAQIYCSTCR
jgi:hypothetical protein